jgi:hypothetical protein
MEAPDAGDELRGHAINVVHGLADDFDIADDRILH